MKTESIQIVDHGRGPQLSTSRITVQDLLPYYRDGASNDEMRRWIPSLTDDEIAVLKDYIRDRRICRWMNLRRSKSRACWRQRNIQECEP